MRCIVGLALFLVLYFGGCKILGEAVAATTFRSEQGFSQRQARLVGAEVVRKYHALVAVGAGAAALVACSVPTLLEKISQRDVRWD